MLDACAAANAASLPINEVTKNFRQSIKKIEKVPEFLTRSQQLDLLSVIDFPVIFAPSIGMQSDHMVVAACRNMARRLFERTFKIKDTRLLTLAIGATAREIKAYAHNNYIRIHIHGAEAKDFDRLFKPLMNDIVINLEKQMHNYKIMQSKRGQPLTRLKEYTDRMELFQDFEWASNLPRKIYNTYVKADQLLFEDSIYNFSSTDIYDAFDETGASIAFGYAMLPLELMFKDMPTNRLYEIRTFRDCGIEKTSLAWRCGYSNGYVHKTNNWKTLLESPVIKGKDFSLVIEIMKYVGPIAIFKIIKTRNSEEIFRSIQLPEGKMYVKIIDLMYGYDKHFKTINRSRYFSVYESEYLDVINYLSALDPKSLTIQNTNAYIRRRKSGVSLVSTEIVKPWAINERDVWSFGVVCYITVLAEMAKQNNVTKLLADPHENVKSWLKSLKINLSAWFEKILEFVFGSNLIDKLVVYPNHMGKFDQHVKIGRCFLTRRKDRTENPISLSVMAGDIINDLAGNDPTNPNCPICVNQATDSKQMLKCGHKDDEDTTINWGMTLDELNDVYTKLTDNAEDQVGMASLKKMAADNLPKAAFDNMVVTHYIRGGPGTGKSHLIRNLADHNDLIVGPFRRLKADYMTTENDYRSYNYKTFHTALGERNKERVFVDEFTCYPYELLAALLYNVGAKEVFLVGDDKQTRVLENQDEGVYVGDKIDLTRLSTHELLVNFRNGRDVVALLNKHYGYNMFTNSERSQTIEVTTFGTKLEKELATRDIRKIAFSKRTAEKCCGDIKSTVRACQGATYKEMVLYVCQGDKSSTKDCLQIVAISRHTEMCYIVHDDSTDAKSFLARLALSPEFYDTLETFIKFPELQTVKTPLGVPLPDPTAIFHKPTQDAFLAIKLLFPKIAFYDDCNSLNEKIGTLVESGFKRSVAKMSNMFMRMSKTGRIFTVNKYYYAIGPGFGLEYNPLAPMQELAVLRQRYDGQRTNNHFSINSVVQIKDMVDEYFIECKNFKDFKTNMFSDDELQDTVNRFLSDIKNKHYLEQFTGRDTPDPHVIRFSLKSMFKPVNNDKGLNLYKAGQGVAAWNVNLNVMFCLAFRWLQHIDQLTNRCDSTAKVYTDNGLSDKEFFHLISDAMKDMNAESLMHGTTDAVMFDSCQNQFTQEIEKAYFRRLGVNEEFINYYFRFRSNSPIVARTFYSKLGYEKASGEPGTLFNNGIVSKVCSNYIMRGKGPFVVLYKGDDYDKTQMDLKVDDMRLHWVKENTDIKFKFWIRRSGEFCGMLVTPEGLVPNYYRRLCKITGCRWRDYAHFTEYQISIRDYVKFIETEVGLTRAIAGVMSSYNINYSQALTAFEAYKSFGHISEQQWLTIVKLRCDSVILPIFDSTAGIIRMDEHPDAGNNVETVTNQIEADLKHSDALVAAQQDTLEDFLLNGTVANNEDYKFITLEKVLHVEDYTNAMRNVLDHNCPRYIMKPCSICDKMDLRELKLLQVCSQVEDDEDTTSQDFYSCEQESESIDSDDTDIKNATWQDPKTTSKAELLKQKKEITAKFVKQLHKSEKEQMNPKPDKKLSWADRCESPTTKFTRLVNELNVSVTKDKINNIQASEIDMDDYSC